MIRFSSLLFMLFPFLRRFFFYLYIYIQMLDILQDKLKSHFLFNIGYIYLNEVPLKSRVS